MSKIYMRTHTTLDGQDSDHQSSNLSFNVLVSYIDETFFQWETMFSSITSCL
jgi:hypothetical protein